MSRYLKLACCLVVAPLLFLWPSHAIAQQNPDKPKVSPAEYDAALDKAVKASQEAAAAKKAAEDAAKKAESTKAELDKLKQEQQQDQDKLDTDGQVKRLEGEIAEAEKKLGIIDKTEQDVVNNVTNPGGHMPLTPEGDKLRQEALGGSSVPSVPKEVRDAFEAKKQKLIDEIKKKKQELDDAKKKAAEQKANPATADELKKKIADREAEIKAKEAELEAAERKAREAEQEKKDAQAAAEQADSEFRELQAQRDKERALDEARRKLKEAEEQLERAKAALERKQAELNKNSDLARKFAELFRLLNKLNELMQKLGAPDADPTGALTEGADILDEIDRLLNDPNSNWQQLKDLLTENEFQLLRDAINGLRNAQRNLQTLVNPNPKPGENRSVRNTLAPNRTKLLRSPVTQFQNPVAAQMYAALERAVANGDLDAIRAMNIVDFIDEDEFTITNWNTVAQSAGMDAASGAAETALVATIGKHIPAVVLFMERRAIELRDELQAAAGDPALLSRAVQAPVRNLIFDSPMSAAQQLEVLDSQFSSTIYRAFQDEIARALAQSSTGVQALSGASVVKGNARVSSGTALPTVSLSLLQNPIADTSQPQNPGLQSPDRSITLRPDSNGDFEFTLPPGTAVRRMQLGGPGLATQVVTVTTAPRGAPAWVDPQLSQEQREATMQR